ncbi:hypothetical protein U9M48_008912 [Paspalum notatum var. saurae]|uniref:Uncharacterized protein n=1 Tax=Paspalum notatum var. saurae TaxID=547442 RepID=A0AAQ3SQN6_PASNO
MEVDAEEEARADAELAASQAAEPVMDGVETGGPSSLAGTIRFRKTVSIRPRCNPTDRSVIVPVGDRYGLMSGVGHRMPVNSALGAYCRFYYPGMVTLPNGDQVAPTSGSIGGSNSMWMEMVRVWVEAPVRALCGKEAKMGTKPSFVDVWIEGHKGLDPENLEILCDEQATEKLAKFKENVIQRHGPEFDWRAAAPDVEAIYDAGGGLRHGRWGLGDGSFEYDHILRSPRTSQGSSFRRPSRAQQEAQQEETRRLQEKTFRLRQNNDYMMTYLVTLSQKLGGDVPEFRPPQPSPQVPLNYFSSPINQGTPLGDAQGWLGSNAPEFRPPQLFPQVPSNYFTTPTSQGSPLGDAQGSQPPLNQIIPFGQVNISQFELL